MPEDKTRSRLVQSDQSGRTTRRTHRHTDKFPLSSNQNPSYGLLDDLQTDHLRLVQSHPSDGLLDELQTDHLRLVQSNPSESHQRNPQEIQVIQMVTDHMSDKIQKPLT